MPGASEAYRSYALHHDVAVTAEALQSAGISLAQAYIYADALVSDSMSLPLTDLQKSNLASLCADPVAQATWNRLRPTPAEPIAATQTASPTAHVTTTAKVSTADRLLPSADSSHADPSVALMPTQLPVAPAPANAIGNPSGAIQKQERPDTVANSEKDGIITAEASALPNRFKKYIPEKQRRIQIINEGKQRERAIFADDRLGELAKSLPAEEGFYDVVIHGYPYGFQYFGEHIDVETLCAIIAQRKDYKKGMNIRLIACNAGSKPDGVAQYIADKLRVLVTAPTKLGIIERKLNGETIVYSGSKKYLHDGQMKTFEPSEGVE